MEEEDRPFKARTSCSISASVRCTSSQWSGTAGESGGLQRSRLDRLATAYFTTSSGAKNGTTQTSGRHKVPIWHSVSLLGRTEVKRGNHFEHKMLQGAIIGGLRGKGAMLIRPQVLQKTQRDKSNHSSLKASRRRVGNESVTSARLAKD